MYIYIYIDRYIKEKHLYIYIYIYVKLNLFNYVLALLCAQFACNSAFRNPAFRWE